MRPGTDTVRRAYRQLDMVGWLSNGLGGLTIFLFVTLLVPRTISDDQYNTLVVRSAVVFGVVFVILMPLGRHLSTVRGRPPVRAGKEAA